MKTLHVLLVSLFAFQELLLASTHPTRLRTQLSLGYSSSSTGATLRKVSLRPPTHPRRHSPPPPTPGHSPEPGPGRTRRAPPTPRPFINIVVPASNNSDPSAASSA